MIKDLTAAMDIAMQGEDGETEFPGTDDAVNESLKTAEVEEKKRKDGGSAAGPSAPPPSVTVEERKDGVADKPAEPAAPAAPAAQATGRATPSPSPSGRSTPRPTGIPIRPALMDRPANEIEQAQEDMIKDNKKKGKDGLSKEQREQLQALRKEQERARKERVDALTEKLMSRVSLWTETDKGGDVTAAFQEKMRLEVEELKMESFGIDICHAIGQTYVGKGSTLLKSQKFLGIGGFFSRMRDKGSLVKDTWNTISSALDAQQEMEEMQRLEERGGEEWTDERRVEYERRVTGKILTAAWRGSKFEIQSVLRDVCDNVLNDKAASLSKRLERAQALILIGDAFNKASTGALNNLLSCFSSSISPINAPICSYSSLLLSVSSTTCLSYIIHMNVLQDTPSLANALPILGETDG